MDCDDARDGPNKIDAGFLAVGLAATRRLSQLFGMYNNLAQIATPSGLLNVRWEPAQRQILFDYNGRTTTRPDGNIYQSLAQIVYGHDLASDVVLSNVRVFEGRPSIQSFRDGAAADSGLLSALPDCDWSDYALDLMAFQATMGGAGAPFPVDVGPLTPERSPRKERDHF